MMRNGKEMKWEENIVEEKKWETSNGKKKVMGKEITGRKEERKVMGKEKTGKEETL